MRTVEYLMEALRKRDTVHCPHCSAEVDMTDGERVMGHVSYWGEDEPAGITCPSCEVDFYLKEHVSRWWTAGRSPEEADKL